VNGRRSVRKLGKTLWVESKWERRCIIAGALFAAILLFLPLDYNPSQADRFLTALVTAQASIVAIVFSVSILGVQLVATRYSNRLVTLITSSIAFQRTLLILGISIGIDLLLLLQLPVLSPRVTIAGLAIVSGLALASGITLVQYVETTLERSTPEGLLTAYAERISPQTYREDVIESLENGGNLHPMHELHSVIMSGLSNGEWATAENGLLKFREVSVRMISGLAEEGKLHRTDPVSTDYFRVPIEEYLPRVTAQAIDDGEGDIAQLAVMSIEKIADAGLKHYFPLILAPTATGLSQVIRDAPSGQEGDSIRGECFGAYSRLVVQAAGQPAPSDVGTLLSLYAAQFRKLLRRDREPWVYRHHLEEFFQRTISPAHRETVNQYGQFIAESDIDWNSRIQPGDTDRVAPYDLLFTYRRYSINVVGDILNYYNRNGEWPVNMSTLQETWTDMIIQAFDTGDYARAVTRSYIDLAYVVCQIEGDSQEEWVVELAILQDDNPSQECIDDAFHRAIEQGITPSFKAETRKVTTADEETWFFNKLMNMPHQGMTEYEEWVREFKQDVDERRQLNTE
jgi:hypothetical protein